jgi:hypothetical protein
MKDNNIAKAVRVGISLGAIPLNVYQMPSGVYKLAGRNVTDAIEKHDSSLREIMGVKSLKALPHADQALLEVRADSGEKFIPVAIEDAVSYWAIMAQKGNQKAVAILAACAIEAIERRADKALGIMVSEQERDARMELRMKRIATRRKWTDALKDRYVALHGVEPSPEQYREWTVKANEALFSRKHFKCDRDNMTETEQHIIESFEFLCCRWAGKYDSKEPDEILEMVLDTF